MKWIVSIKVFYKRHPKILRYMYSSTYDWYYPKDITEEYQKALKDDKYNMEFCTKLFDEAVANIKKHNVVPEEEVYAFAFNNVYPNYDKS